MEEISGLARTDDTLNAHSPPRRGGFALAVRRQLFHALFARHRRKGTEWQQATTRGRWAPFWNGRTFTPPNTDARKEARNRWQRWSKLSKPGHADHVPLAECLSGNELLAERKHIADGGSFLEPVTDEARELVALLPHGRLRWVEAKLLAALAYAMLARKRRGLVATLEELGQVCGLKTTAIATSMGRLVALGLVRSDPTFTRKGKCKSQRGNLWRLTTQAVTAFGFKGPFGVLPLQVPPGVVLPQGTVDRARLERRRGIAQAHATPRNALGIQDLVQAPEKNLDPFRNGHRTADASGAVSASRTGIVSLPDESHLPSQPEARQAETRSAVGSARRAEESMTESDDAVIERLASLVSDPAARAAMLAAKPPKKGGAQ